MGKNSEGQIPVDLPATTGGAEEPDLSDEELAILDQVWDEYAAREAQKKGGPTAS